LILKGRALLTSGTGHNGCYVLNWLPVGELAGADLADMDFDLARLKVLGKGREERKVFITGCASISVRIT
jgi:site-specific recombinase XerC